jgi:hypothetical protein
MLISDKNILIIYIKYMDLIYSNNKTPFVSDKTLWVSAVTRKPGYDDLLNFEGIIDSSTKSDNDEQRHLRIAYQDRHNFIRHKQRYNGKTRNQAIAEWNQVWNNVPGAIRPPNNLPMSRALWRPGHQGKDLFGHPMANNAQGVLDYTDTKPIPFSAERNWLANNPGYRPIGWTGNQNNPVIGIGPPGAAPWVPPAIGLY